MMRKIGLVCAAALVLAGCGEPPARDEVRDPEDGRVLLRHVGQQRHRLQVRHLHHEPLGQPPVEAGGALDL